MLQRDIRQQHDTRLEHVRRVVTAAQTRFDNRDVHLLCAELGQRGRGHNLELGRAFGVRAHTLDRTVEVCLAAGDPDPFRPGADMRGVVGADVQALRRE